MIGGQADLAAENTAQGDAGNRNGFPGVCIQESVPTRYREIQRQEEQSAVGGGLSVKFPDVAADSRIDANEDRSI